MTHPSPSPSTEPPVIAYFWSGEVLRSRSVSDGVLHGLVDIPPPPDRLVADWERDAQNLGLEAGDVEALPLARARARWPGYRQCTQALADWAHGQGLAQALEATTANGDVALMACRGARYHFDAVQYGGAAFCNLFLSEDKGLDLHFPAIGLRLPLQRGLAVVFDTAQPHAVVPRGGSSFDASDFATGQDCSQFFLTWELAIEDAPVAQALHITLDPDPATARTLIEAQVRQGEKRLAVEPQTGQWCRFEALSA